MTIHPVRFVENKEKPDELLVEKSLDRVFVHAPPFTPNTDPNITRYTEKHKCRGCGWIGSQDDMDADAIFNGEDEFWSSWICPACGTWWQGLLEGYEKVE